MPLLGKEKRTQMFDLLDTGQTEPHHHSKVMRSHDPTMPDGDEFQSDSSLPFEPGSIAAKKAWLQIDFQAHSPEAIAKAKAMGYEKATGLYQGKPLVPGAGANQGDFQFLVDKLHYYNGYDIEVAKKIAASVKAKLYGTY